MAAAGNEFASGNAPQYPGSLPHVLTVSAVDADLQSSMFANANAAVDVAAPGESIVTAVPAAQDPDGTPDGYAAVDGTSFAAPMAAAAVAWVRAARPALTPDQAVQTVRISAKDIDREGYDANTGFGLLDIGAALAATPPPPDPAEPNEDIRWVDERARPLYRSGRGLRVTALLDRYEDPRDVYRVVVPAGKRLSISVTPRFGDADLTVHDRSARTVTSRRARLGASMRDGRRTDTLTVAIRTRRARTVWVGVVIDDAARSLDSSYVLAITPGRRR